MSLTYINGATLSSASIRNGCTDEINNQVLIVESTGPSLRKYNLNTVAQVGSNITCVSSPSAICLINSASAVITSSSSGSVDFIELSTNYRVNVTGAPTVSSTSSKQVIAADPTNSVAMACTSTAKQLVRINGSTFNTTNLSNLEIVGSSTFTCIILKSPGRWLAGTSLGEIVEVDSTGKVYDRMRISIENNVGREPDSGSLLITDIYGLAFDNNMLLVSTGQGVLLYYDWTTKTLLNTRPICVFSGGQAFTLSNTASGVTCGGSLSTSSGSPFVALDITCRGLDTDGYIFTGGTGAILAAGINTLNARGWFLFGSTNLRVFSLSPNRVTTTRTFTVTDSGQNVENELILLDYEASSIGKPILHTYMKSPATYRVESGKVILEIIKYGDGDNAKFAFNKYTS